MARRMIMIGGWSDLYEKAKNCGFDLTVVQRKQMTKQKDLEIVDQFISSPLSDKSIVDIVAAIHAHNPFDVVLSFQELGLLNAALIKEKLGLQGNPLAPVLLTRDKGKMRDHMKKAGIPSIPHAIVSNVAEVIDFGRNFGWPIIIKPANGVGSLHIHKLNSEDDVEVAFNAIRQDPTATRLISHDFPQMAIIAEKFINGPEISVEAITWEGQHSVLMITDKMHAGYPSFVETGHTMPSALPDETIQAIKRLTVSFLDSIGHQYGPSHTEIIISASGPIIVESHTRPGGDQIFEMVELACGIDMFMATLQGFAGEFPAQQIHEGGSAAIRYFTLPSGRIESVVGIAEVELIPGVVRCNFSQKVGDETRSVQYSDDRAGYILTKGTSERTAEDIAILAMGTVKIKVSQ